MAGQGPQPGRHRNGPTGYVKLWLEMSQTRFVAFAAAECYAEAV